MFAAKKQWSVEEEQEMLGSLRKGLSFDRIAQQHDRTRNAIQLRFAMICRREMENNAKTIEDLGKEYGTSVAQIRQYMKELETIQKKNHETPITQQPVPSEIEAEIIVIKEQILLLNDKTEKIYKCVKKLLLASTKTK